VSVVELLPMYWRAWRPRDLPPSISLLYSSRSVVGLNWTGIGLPTAVSLRSPRIS
jgi:hypothetical protein